MQSTPTDPQPNLRYQQVIARVKEACHNAERRPEDLTLLAVSKTHPAAMIAQLYAEGQRDFGENYVQEWLDKYRELEDLTSICWHQIGPLQRNKCKYVAGKVALIHTVHSLSIAEELEKRTPAGQQQAILLQANSAGEDSKSGFATLQELIDVASRPWERLRIQGLMTIPPYDDDPEESRPHFQALRRWKEQLEVMTGLFLPHLSMGMSHDLEVAIEEGATIIRVGTAIFGARTP